MIKRDELCLIGQHSLLDPEYLNFGDSCMKTSMNALNGPTIDVLSLHHFVLPTGEAVRHPREKESNDPRTTTRDQLVPLLAALSQHSFYTPIARKIFWNYAKRGFLGQNYLNQDLSKKPWYSGRDLFHPGYILLMAHAARMKWVYRTLYIPGMIFLYLEYLFGVYVKPSRESNQTLALLGTLSPTLLKRYCANHYNWQAPLDLYWNNWRDQPEINENIKKWVLTKINK